MTVGLLIHIFVLKLHSFILARGNSKYTSFFLHELFSSLELHEPSKERESEEKKRLILFAGVLQLLEYGSVNHCTGLLLPACQIMG